MDQFRDLHAEAEHAARLGMLSERQGLIATLAAGQPRPTLLSQVATWHPTTLTVSLRVVLEERP
jgi:hypothetical protein